MTELNDQFMDFFCEWTSVERELDEPHPNIGDVHLIFGTRELGAAFLRRWWIRAVGNLDVVDESTIIQIEEPPYHPTIALHASINQFIDFYIELNKLEEATIKNLARVVATLR